MRWHLRQQDLFILLIGTIVVVSVFTLIPSGQAQTSAPVESTLPAIISPCLPKMAEQIELLGQVQEEQNIFYLLGVSSRDRYWESLIQTNAAGCLVIKGQRDTHSLSAYIPMEIAQQLVLQRYQRRIAEAGGLAAFQQGFTEHMNQQTAGEMVYLAPENIWALQQLGVEIPEGTYQIRRPGTHPNFDQFPDPRTR